MKHSKDQNIYCDSPEKILINLSLFLGYSVNRAGNQVLIKADKIK